MVTPEERITRLEAMQEANLQRFADVISRQDALLVANESVRRDLANAIDASRREARDASEAARKEAREDNEAARKESRNLFIAGFSIGAALFTGFGAGTIALLFRVLERLPA